MSLHKSLKSSSGGDASKKSVFKKSYRFKEIIKNMTTEQVLESVDIVWQLPKRLRNTR